MKKLGVGLLTVVMLLTLTGVALVKDPMTITIWEDFDTIVREH